MKLNLPLTVSFNYIFKSPRLEIVDAHDACLAVAGSEGTEAVFTQIVTACNVHAELVRRACDVLEALEDIAHQPGALPVRIAKLKAALTAAGAA